MTKRTELFFLRSSAGKRVVAFNLSDALITINVAAWQYVTREGRVEQRREVLQEDSMESTDSQLLVCFFFK